MQIRFRLTLDDVVAFNTFHRKRSSFWKMIYVVFGVVALFFSAMPFFSQSYADAAIRTKIVAAVLSAVPWIVLILLARLLNNFQVRRLYAEGKNKGLLCEHLLTLADDGLTDKTEFGEIRSSWPVIERLEIGPDHAFAYFHSLAAHVIPRKGVIEGDYDAFVKELRGRVRL